MKRSENSELAQRINQAFALLEEEMPHTQIIDRLMIMFGVSKIQAYRYVQQAKENKSYIAVPEISVVFTVKLSPNLINRVRKFASFQGTSIGKVVKTALEDFLARKDHVQSKETS